MARPTAIPSAASTSAFVAMYEDSGIGVPPVILREQFWYHNAGASGLGGSSYIDDVVLRDRDTDANGTLDERRYYLQNQHHDVVALISTSGSISERVNYDPYGSPIGTFTSIGNRKGYAGYEYDENISTAGAAGTHTWHVRHRVYRSDLGVWTRRDPLGYVDGMGLYEYVAGHATALADPFGAAGGFSGTDVGEQCDPLLPCDNPAACGTCGGGHGLQPIGPTVLPGEPAPGVDTAELRCKGIILPIPQHCFVRCCPGGKPPCTTYSLNPDQDGRACMQKNHQRDKDRPGDKPRGFPHRRVRASNLCDCLEAAWRANITNANGVLQPCRDWNYSPFSCNSNWYVNSMWKCCTNQHPGAPVTAPFGMPWDCCRRGEFCNGSVYNCPFKCDFTYDNGKTPRGQGFSYCECACAA